MNDEILSDVPDLILLHRSK